MSIFQTVSHGENTLMKFKDKRKYISWGITAAVVILIALAGYFVLSHAGSIGSFFKKIIKILMPFVFGFAVAYLLSPLCNKLEGFFKKRCPGRNKFAKPVSISLALLFALIIVAAVLVLVIPSLAKSIIGIAQALPSELENAASWIHNLFEKYPALQTAWDTISERVMNYISSWDESDLLSAAKSIIGSVGTTVAGFFVFLKNVFLGILISVYLLASRKKFSVQAKKLLYGIFKKKWADTILDEVRYADKMFNGFFVGRIIDSAIIGVICFAFTAICRFESAVLVSVIVGVTNIIPFFGPYIGAIPCALLLLLENPIHCLVFLIFIIILQIVDGNLIGPHILGQTTGVSSFWVLFSIMLFGGLWGIIGMLIGVPLFAVIYDIVKKLVYKGLSRPGHENPDSPEPAKVNGSSEEPPEDIA